MPQLLENKTTTASYWAESIKYLGTPTCNINFITVQERDVAKTSLTQTAPSPMLSSTFLKLVQMMICVQYVREGTRALNLQMGYL